MSITYQGKIMRAGSTRSALLTQQGCHVSITSWSKIIRAGSKRSALMTQQGKRASITSQGKIMRLKQRPLMGHTGSSELRSSRRSVQASPQTCAAPQRSQTKMLLLSCLHGSPRPIIASPVAQDAQGALAKPSEQAIHNDGQQESGLRGQCAHR